MTHVRGQPPGRAGRTWLLRRLGAARRSADLLDRRLLILREQQSRFADRAHDTRIELDQLTDVAEAAGLRAALVLGDAALSDEAAPEQAGVEIEWAALIGTRFPSGARVELPVPAPDARVASSASVPVAAAAYRQLLGAAIDHAVAAAAARVVDDEVVTTRFRLRAIEDRWVPRLERARTQLDLALAEDERGEAIRMRWAAGGEGEPGKSRKVTR